MRRSRVGQLISSRILTPVAILAVLVSTGEFGHVAVAGEIESLLQRGLPTSLDPAAAVQAARESRPYPLKPLVRLPFYGLPYDLVDTTTGRLAFRVDDLALPGRMPIVMSRFYDSGGNTDIPPPPSLFWVDWLDAYDGADLGPFWSLSYTDYIQPVAEGFVLVPPEGGPIVYVAQPGQPDEFVKSNSFPSNHVRLHRADAMTLEETRADGTVWSFYQSGGSGHFLLDRITDRHGNFIVLNYMGDDILTMIWNSSGSQIMISHANLIPDESCPPCPLSDKGCREAQRECQKPPPIARIQSISDGMGRSISFTYDDPYQQLTSWTDVMSHTWTVGTAPVGGRVTSIHDPLNRAILTASYDDAGRVHEYSTGDAASVFSYTSTTTTTIVDGRQNAWKYIFNAQGITTQVIDPQLHSSSITLDSANNIASFTDPNGSAWQFTYRPTTSEPLTVTSPVTGAGPVVWHYAYDNAGHLASVRNPRGYITRFERSTENDILSEHEDFDGDGVVDANEPRWQATYSYEGDLLYVENPRSKLYTFTYDQYGQVDTVTLPCAQAPCPSVDLDFDSRGYLRNIRRAISATEVAQWSYAYNLRGQLMSATDPTGYIRTYAYDDAGLLTGVTDPMHGATSFSYTPSYRRSTITDALGAVTSYVYDGAGNLTTRQDALGNATVFAYDVLNLLHTRTDPLGRAWNYTYDPAGNLTLVTYPNTHQVAMTYDAAGRLATRTYPNGIVESFSRDQNGNLTLAARGNGTTLYDRTSFTYNERDLPREVSTLFPPPGGLGQPGTGMEMGARFEYDLNGNRTATLAIDSPSASTHYTYDDLDRLAGVVYGTGQSRTLSYDPWSLRRTSFPTRGVNNAATYSYDPAGRLDSFTIAQGEALDDGTYALHYDGSGRLDTVNKGTDHTTYEYNTAGRLVREVLSDGTQKGFVYDPLGRLVRVESATGDGVPIQSHEFIYNAAGELVTTDVGWTRFDYTYDYSGSVGGAMLRIKRERSREGASTREIEIGYDGRLAREFAVTGTGAETLSASYLWIPFATAQIETLSASGPGGTMVQRNVLDALGGPLVSTVGEDPENESGYEQATVIDEFRASGFFKPRAVRDLLDREHFRLFARRHGLDPAASGGGGAVLALSGARAGSFGNVADLLTTLSRRDEIPPHLVSLGDLEALPGATYVDPDTDVSLAPPSLEIPRGLGGAQGMYGETDIGAAQGGADLSSLGLLREATSGSVVSALGFTGIPIAGGCPAGMNYECFHHARGIDANLGNDESEPSGPTVPGMPFRRGRNNLCSNTVITHRCPHGPGCGSLPYDPARDANDQEPYQNASGDPYGVEVSNGEYVLSVTDLQIPWVGMPFRFTRTYRSKVHNTTELGAGWTHNYMERLEASDQTCIGIRWLRGDQWSGLFTAGQDSDTYAGPLGSHLLMKRDSNSTSARYTIRLPDGELHEFDASGYLSSVKDRYGNALTLFYSHLITDARTGLKHTRLITVRGPLNHEVQFHYDSNARLDTINDCGGTDVNPNGVCDVSGWRFIKYTHDANDDLTDVTSPIVNTDCGGTTNIPCFSNGKKTSYTYSHDPSKSQTDPVNHNLQGITDAAGNLAGGTTPFVKISYYGGDPLGPKFDRVHTVEFLKDLTPSYDAVNYDYDQGGGGASTTVINRAGEKTEYSFDDNRRMVTRIVYPTDNPAVTITDEYHYDAQDQVTYAKTGQQFDSTHGGITFHWEEYKYDNRGNLLEKRVRPDGVRSSGPSLITRYTYDPVFNQLRTTTDPRAWPNVSGDTPIATDVAHPDEPLLSDNAVGKYTTTRWFDYQDGPRADIQHDLDTWWLNGAVNQSSITFGSGTTNQRAGTVVKETHQLWTDPDHPGGSSLIDTLETHYAVNTRGQPLFTRTLMVPDGSQYRETRFDYWTDSQMGLLYHKVVDLDSDGTAPGIQTTYTYDNWGNLETETDGRLKVTTYSVNALNQIYRVVRNSAGAVGQQYAEETVYDANNNVQFKRVQKQPQAQSGDPRVFIDVESTYDLLDRKTAEVVTVDGRQRATHYVYDKEGRLIRKILPVGNVIGYTYDKVGRQTDVRRYARRSPDGTSAPSADNTNDALTSVRYDGRGNPVSERVTYNANGSGLSTTFLYDGYDRKIETRRHTRTDWSFPVDTNGDGTPAGTEDNYLSEKLTYDVAGLVTAVEQLGDADGQIETNELLAKTETVYDEMGRAILSYQLLDNGSFLPTTHLTHTTSDPVTKTFYTRAGQAARVILPRDATRSNETQFIYDMAGRKKQVTDAFGNVVKYTYDAEDHVTEVRSIEKDSDDVTLRTYVTTSAYDQLGRLIGNSVDPGGTGTLHLTTIYTHDLRGNVTATTDPAGHRTEKDYNEANQVLRSRLCRVGVPTAAPCTGSGQFEETVQYTYDVNGLLAVQTDGLGNETKFLYDELDRKAYTRYPDDTGVAWVYDRAGRTVGIRRQAQVLGVSGAYNMDQHFEPRGSGSTIADPGYDCTGTPACLAETDTYDTRSRLRQRDFSWHNTSSLEYGGTTRQTFAYDGLSRLLASTDNNELASTADDAVIQRSYDTLSRLRAETQTLGSAQLRTVSSAYDLGGARTALTYASTSGGGQPAFTIDTLGRTTAITDGTPIATQLFSGPGLLESRTYGNGMVLNMKAAEGRGYDLAKRIVRVKLEMPNSQTPAAMHFEYGYDADSLRTYERRLHESAVGSSYPGQVFTHVYDHDGDGTATDAAHRLETFSEGYLASTGALATMTQKDSRGYDVEGNWMSITQTVSGSAPTTTSNNRRDAGQGAGMNQYLDFKGNSWLYTFTGALKDDGVQLYRYDGLDRLIEVKHKSPLAVLGTYAYDADNRRVLKTDSSGSTQFVYDGWRGIEDYPVGQALPTARYFWANGVERLLAIQRYEANAWKRRYVHGDALGSVRAVTDTPTGTNAPQVEARFLFGSFGEAIVAGTSGVLSGCGTVYCAVPFRYTGQRFDPESGLYYYKNRYYSPAAGRFLTRDPAGYVDGPNLYAYVRNSATNDGDPLGLFEGGPSTVFGRYCAMGWDNEAGHALNAMEDQMDNFDYDNWEDHHSAEQETNPASQIIGGEGGVSGGPMIMITAPVYSSPSKSKPSPAESAAPSRLKVHVYVDFKDKDIGKNQQKDIMRDAQNRFDEARDNGLDFDVQVENVTGKAVPALGNMDSYIEVGGSRPADSTSLDESGHMWHGTGQGNVWSTTISTKVADRIPAGATRMDAFHTILADNIAHEAGHRLAPANLSPDEPWHDRAGGIMGRKYEWERSVGRIPSTQYNLTPRQFLGTTIGVFNTYAKNPSP